MLEGRLRVAQQELWLSRIRAHGLWTPLGYAQDLRTYVVNVDAITCPTFVSCGEDDVTPRRPPRNSTGASSCQNKKFVRNPDADLLGHCRPQVPLALTLSSRFATPPHDWGLV